MADEELLDYRTDSADTKDEIEGLNEKLIQLLSAQKVLPANTSNTCKTVDGDCGVTAGVATSASPSCNHYRHSCPLQHHDSPVNLPVSSAYLPPIGVFWDIENCQVPKGRSAIAATQVIRDKFFHGYREAEFIVVCDVQKENSQVMQELNDAQVNLIHVAATCKNAADEKLKQSIRRFADIHGSSAAIILISGDINFAADLSDLRHRKKIHVILLHKQNTSEALILCANEHYNFAELMEPLPSRTPMKDNRMYDVIVSNLPEDKDTILIKRRLKQLSENCGGRIIDIQSNTAVVRFMSRNSAIRAQKRMDGEFVLGSKISVRSQKEKESTPNKIQSFTIARTRTVSESEIVSNSTKQMYSAGASLVGARTLQFPHYQSSSPVIGAYPTWTSGQCAPMNTLSGLIQPPPVFLGRPYSHNLDISFNRSQNEVGRLQSPLVWQVPGPHAREEQYKGEKAKIVGKRSHIPQVRDGTTTNNVGSQTPEGMRRIRGTHSSFNHSSEWSGPRQLYHPVPTNPNFNGNALSQPNSFKRRSPSPMYDMQTRERNQWNGQHPYPVVRNTRTPSPYENSAMQTNQRNNHSYHHSDTENEEVEIFFNPINNRNGNGGNNVTPTPIELQVTNLDQNIEPKELKRILSSVFMEHVTVLHVSVFMQSDGNFAASVKVPSLPDAQYAISQLHRRKVGYKRILISYAHIGGPNPQIIRAQIVMLLQEVPGHRLPLFKFREMYESRFMISISISELYKLKDVCIITEDPSGRMVSLNPDHRNTPSPSLNNTTQEGNLELPYCTIHTVKPWIDKGWAEQEMASLPNVKISLKILAPRIHQLLKTHNGSLPLPSLPHCYEAEFQEQLQVMENGVPLEHLVSCLSSIELKQGLGSVKYIIWVGDKTHNDSHEENKCVSPPLANQLTLFSRELVDLLKTAPHCQLLFNRFIPAYHHHFGRQCRVADYGFTKLIDLLEALTHTVQVMGEGNKRVVTLSHRAQVRRFTSDLLRVLKSKASKQVALSEFPSVYARVIGKPWDIVDYGVCEIEDILSEVSENTVVVTTLNGNDQMIAIPKREQTPEEIERTKQFAVEVVELLRHAPQCRMLFNKFIPSYHHHFGHQCRVSDYGFTKLIELFEAIPNIVKIEDTIGGERQICLTEKEGLRVLGEQISKLISKAKGGLNVSNVAQTFLHQFGYALRPELFGCNSILELMYKLDSTVKVVDSGTGSTVVAINRPQIQHLALQCRRILMDQPDHKMSVKNFEQHYLQYYSKSCKIDEFKKDLSTYIYFTTTGNEEYIHLNPLQSFACNVYRVLMNFCGMLNLSQFESAYLAVIGTPCRAAQYGFPTLLALLQALPCTVIIKDTRRRKKVLYLNNRLTSVGIPMPSVCMSTTPCMDTDSSSESFESDSSSRANVSNITTTLEEHEKWAEKVVDSDTSWSQNEDNTWSKDSDKWKAIVPVERHLRSWPVLETGGDSFLKSLIRTPILQNKFPPPPPKPDSPPEDDLNKSEQWKSLVWMSPTKFSYSQDEHTNVKVPPLTLPSWNQMSSNDPSSLLSPTKNLLTAVANPLNPRSSPYYTSKGDIVVAPHPSELPLPSLSLTPKKSKSAECTTVVQNGTNGQKTSDTSEEETTNMKNSDITEVEEKRGIRNAAAKHLFTGKRRLAAQFDQSIES